MLGVLYLWTAHTIADFFLQTNWMAVNKSKRLDALMAHVLVYSIALTVATLSPFFGLVTFLAHFCTDYVTSRLSRAQFPFLPVQQRAGGRRLDGNLLFDAEGQYGVYSHDTLPFGIRLKRSRHNFFCTIGVDQWLHMAQLILTAYYLGWRLPWG